MAIIWNNSVVYENLVRTSKCTLMSWIPQIHTTTEQGTLNVNKISLLYFRSLPCAVCWWKWS